MIPKINCITKSVVSNNMSKNVIKKVSLPIAGVTGLAALSGSWGGEMKPMPGVNYEIPLDSVDDPILDSLVYKLKRAGKSIIEDTPLEAPLREFAENVSDKYEALIDGVKDYGDAVVDACSEYL